MKKTIAVLAMMASSNALAIVGPEVPNQPEPQVSKVCFQISSFKIDGNKVLYSASCDETRNNESDKRPILANGCAKNQVSMTFEGASPVESCHPPGFIQL